MQVPQLGCGSMRSEKRRPSPHRVDKEGSKASKSPRNAFRAWWKNTPSQTNVKDRGDDRVLQQMHS